MASGEEGIPEFESVIDFTDIEVEMEIGHGAFGKVFKATYFGTPVAVKQIQQAETEEEKTFIRREVAILQGIRHPNCVQFIGITNDPSGLLHIVTDYVSGGNLRSVLKDESRYLSWHWRVSIATDIAGAMAYLHVKNIIFRDLKSKNVLVEGSRAKICDFGLARAKSSTLRPMTICGTDDWMAPEVILGMDYDTRADVFSFGIVLLELMTRSKVSLTLQRTPMDAFGLNEEQARKIIPPECPPVFSEFAFQTTAYEPERRPTFKQLSQELNKFLKTLVDQPAPQATKPTSAPPPSRGGPGPKPGGSRGSQPAQTRGPPGQRGGPPNVPPPAAPQPTSKVPPTAQANKNPKAAAPVSQAPPPNAKRPKVGGVAWPPK